MRGDVDQIPYAGWLVGGVCGEVGGFGGLFGLFGVLHGGFGWVMKLGLICRCSGVEAFIRAAPKAEQSALLNRDGESVDVRRRAFSEVAQIQIFVVGVLGEIETLFSAELFHIFVNHEADE